MKHGIRLALIAILLLITFQNCGPSEGPESQSVSSGSTATAWPSPSGLPMVNYFSASPPTDMSGEIGYTFLLNQYFYRQCGGCHDANGFFAPKFADITKPQSSYNVAKAWFDRQDMIGRITTNPFCKPSCTLDPRGQMYQAIMYWLDHR